MVVVAGNKRGKYIDCGKLPCSMFFSNLLPAMPGEFLRLIQMICLENNLASKLLKKLRKCEAGKNDSFGHRNKLIWVDAGLSIPMTWWFAMKNLQPNDAESKHTWSRKLCFSTTGHFFFPIYGHDLRQKKRWMIPNPFCFAQRKPDAQFGKPSDCYLSPLSVLFYALATFVVHSHLYLRVMHPVFNWNERPISHPLQFQAMYKISSFLFGGVT